MSIRAYRDIHRRKSRQIMVGKVPVGGDAPITVQTMTNTITGDARATIDQIRRIEEAGADIVRVSCPDEDATKAMKAITKAAAIPVVADIHFHYKRAIESAVNGAAYAGGLEMALNADFIYAVRSARFALTETSIGIMPGAGGTQNLPRACGVRRAKEIILTAQPFTAEEAFEWGIVNKLCAPETLMAEALATARAIAANAPIAIRQAKKSINMATQLDLKSGYAFEIEAYNRMVPTRDRLEGIRAFNEKRKPQFKGE